MKHMSRTAKCTNLSTVSICLLSLYTNAKSVYHKFEELSDIVTERKPLVVGITETWLKSDIKDAEINLQGYDLFRSDRKKDCQFGVSPVNYSDSDSERQVSVEVHVCI